MILYNTADADNLFTDNHCGADGPRDFSDGTQIKHYIDMRRRRRDGIDHRRCATTSADGAVDDDLLVARPEPAAPDIIKPDITAPGVQILAGNSPDRRSARARRASCSRRSPARRCRARTSPACSPCSSRRTRTGRRRWRKSALMTTADTDVVDNDRRHRRPTRSPWAPAMLNPGIVDGPGSAFKPGLVYDAGFTDYLGFLCDAGPEVFGNPTATCARSRGRLPDRRRATSTTRRSASPTSPAPDRHPHGHERRRQTAATSGRSRSTRRGVHGRVDPSEITLAPGAVATYHVTITSNGTRADRQWTFGDLTWKGAGGYDVAARSPSAGARFDAPAEITGTGVSGTATST